MARVELVYDPACPNVAAARAQLLQAFARTGSDARWQERSTDDETVPAHVRRYGSPTILVDGKDVAGEEPEGEPCCRLYASPGGALSRVPSVEVIASALVSGGGASGAPGVTGGRSWGLNLAMLPGLGAAFVPKVACPACWPAYAGFLSAAGLGFLLDTIYLFPITAAFLAAAVAALGYRAPRRRGYRPLLIGIAAAVLVLAGKFFFESDPAIYAGLALLVVASTWNSWPRRREDACPACVGSEQKTPPMRRKP